MMHNESTRQVALPLNNREIKQNKNKHLPDLMGHPVETIPITGLYPKTDYFVGIQIMTSLCTSNGHIVFTSTRLSVRVKMFFFLSQEEILR